MANRSEIPAADENASLRARVAELEQRLADYEQYAGLLGEIAQAVTAATGGAFFHALVEGLAKSLNIEHAMVGELVEPPGQRIKILAMYSQGAHAAEVEYDLDGTPCENVMAGQLCIYPRDIQNLFPRDRVLVEMDAECYVGTPLYDSKGQSIGLVVLIGTTPLVDAPRAEATLRIFAARAAAELERLRAEAALRESEGRLRRIFDSNMFGIQYWNSDGRTVDANDALLNLLGYTREDLRAGRVSWRDMTPPEYAHLDQRGLAEIREKGFCTPFEKEYFRKDGARVPVLLGAIQDDAPTRGMCFVIDLTRLKQAENELRQTSQMLQSLIQASPVAINIIDLDGNVKLWSPAAERTFGWSAAEALGRPPPMIPPEYVEEFHRLRDDVMQGRSLDGFETRRCRKDGSYIDVGVSAAPLRDAHGMLIGSMGLTSDITNRKAAEQALRESEQRFKAFMDNNPSVAFMKDLSGRYIYVNKPFCTRFNRELDAVVGSTDYDLFPADIAVQLRENDAAILASGRTRQFAEAVPTPDGVLRHWLVYKFPIEDAAGRVLLGGVAIDVTDQKQAEEALRESEETVRRQFAELENIYNSAPVGLAMMDLDLRYVRVNSELASRNGLSPANHIGKRLRDVIPELALQIEPLYQRVIETGLAIVNFEIHGRAPDDPEVERDWLATYSPLKRLDGGVLGVSVVVQDVTEIKQAQEEIRKARDELELQVAERTASLVQANTDLQHEILERQAAVKALRDEQLLLRQLLDSQEADRKLIAYEVHDGLVQYVTGAVMHLESVAVTGGRKPGDLGDDFSLALRLLRDTIQEARRMISGLRPLILDESGVVHAIEYLVGECKDGPRVDFEHDVAFDRLSPLVEGAIFRICQQALNNATKHSKSKVIRIQLVQRGDWVRLVVSDQGVGFDPAKITEKMFGLQGIRERTRLLGGRAAIVTAPGRGTQVTIDIPLSPSG